MPVSQEQFDKIAKDLPGMGSDPQSVRARVEALEKILERAFVIPGTKIPFGLDSVIGLVPVLGDVVTAVMGGPQSGHVEVAACQDDGECRGRYRTWRNPAIGRRIRPCLALEQQEFADDQEAPRQAPSRYPGDRRLTPSPYFYLRLFGRSLDKGRASARLKIFAKAYSYFLQPAAVIGLNSHRAGR